MGTPSNDLQNSHVWFNENKGSVFPHKPIQRFENERFMLLGVLPKFFSLQPVQIRVKATFLKHPQLIQIAFGISLTHLAA